MMTTPDEEFDDNVEIVDESTLEEVDDRDLPTEDQLQVSAPVLTPEELAAEAEADNTEKRTSADQD
jgi:hypothetical protein